MGYSRTPQTGIKQSEGNPTATFGRDKAQQRGGDRRKRNTNYRRHGESSNAENCKSATRMGASVLQPTAEQSRSAEDKTHDLELAHQQYNDLQTPHNRDAAGPTKKDRNIHV